MIGYTCHTKIGIHLRMKEPLRNIRLHEIGKLAAAAYFWKREGNETQKEAKLLKKNHRSCLGKKNLYK